jgi:hypothetical protein
MQIRSLGARAGTVEATGIVIQKGRAWFGGQAGLTLAHP